MSKENGMKSISIVGSCQSRDIFNSKFVENYRRYFKVYSYFTMTSALSFMSEPIPYNYHNLINCNYQNHVVEHWFQELEKNLLKTLESKKPDILLMDFYADARYGAISYCGEYLINRLARLKNREIIDFENLGIRYNYQENADDFFMMWKNAIDRFMDFVKQKLPETTVVINTVKGSNVVRKSNGEEYVAPKLVDLEIDKINAFWRKLDEYVIQNYDVKALYFEKDYRLDENYPFGGLGAATVHFHKDYYTDCFEKLLEATMYVNQVDDRESTVNLISDSTFKKGVSNWTHRNGRFNVIPYAGYNAIIPVDEIQGEKKRRPQIWSKAVEILGDGKTSYCLSFYIKVAELEKIDTNKMVFAIRTFNNVNGIKDADAIETYKLTLKDHPIKSNKEYRYVYKFTPTGKYLKVAPFMMEYMPGIEYSRVKLERVNNVSDYTS